MEIRMGGAVITSDGEEIGATTLVLFHPGTNLVSHVVVSLAGEEAKRHAVPLWAIERDGGDSLLLETTAEDTARFPLYRPRHKPHPGEEPQEAPLAHEPGEYPALFPEDGSIPAGTVALSGQVGVECSQGPAGHLAGLLTDDYTAELVTLLVRLDAPEDRVVAVPMEWARGVNQHTLTLACDPEDLQTLPAFESELA